MADIGIIQYKTGPKGGAQSVCMHAIDALQEQHNITLFVPYQVNIKKINEFHGTNIDSSLEVYDNKIIKRIFTLEKQIKHKTSSNFFSNSIKAIKWASFLRSIYKRQNGFDLIFWASRGPNIGASYEHNSYETQPNMDDYKGMEIIKITQPSIRYVHHPYTINYNTDIKKELSLKNIGSRVCEYIIGSTPKNEYAEEYMCNSNWTANTLNSHDDSVDAKVIYPPINTSDFESNRVDWRDRENGFICAGRISPSKEILSNIHIIEGLRDLGHDVHLHIVGPKSDSSYYERVRRESLKRDYVKLDGKLSRKDFIRTICNHKYGIHSKKYERFGIVVAEMVSGGLLPFVHESGGQKEIVNIPELMHECEEDAIDKIDYILSSNGIEEEILEKLDSNREEFDKDTFKSKIKLMVQNQI